MKLRLQRFFLRLILGRRTFEYMCKTLAYDPRLRSAHIADIVIRKDGSEKRVEADWLKKLCAICIPRIQKT